MATTKPHVIELSRTLSAPPEKVFRALTEPALLERWFPTKAEVDLRVGGRIAFRFESPEHGTHTREGVIREMVPGRRLVYTWPLPEGETIVAWTLTPKGTGTELRLVHSGWGDGKAWEESFGAHTGGWAFFLDNLGAHLAGGADGRKARWG